MRGEIDIAFVQECESWRLASRFFPSKVGGKPAWLDLKNLPTLLDIECRVCKNPCVFLLQIYAPYEDEERAFHRTLYVFVCKNEACYTTNDNRNFRVLRSQLPRQNLFYPFDPPEEHQHWRPDIEADKWSKTCTVCGIAAPSHCAKCKNANYCCRVHQLVDWKAGHKERCGAGERSRLSRIRDTTTAHYSRDIHSLLFHQYELAMEREDNSAYLQNSDDESTREQKELRYFASLEESGKTGTFQSKQDLDALEKMAIDESDETFKEFRERVATNPDQVLRYDRGGTPLYISSIGKPQVIPKCQECNGQRHFEFQIMPQLLYYLKFDNVLQSFDWGTLLIYTCRNSCQTKSDGYVAEYICKQDIVQDESPGD